jgi:hypothetical protein
MRADGIFTANQDQFGIRVLREVLQCGGDDHGRTMVTSHGIQGDRQHFAHAGNQAGSRIERGK